MKDNKTNFMCEECCLTYKNKKWAEKCWDWCREHKSCNLNIIRHSIKPNQEKLAKK